MTKRKNQNSILVLATLGVYLGLALAGAAPQVLAQAAMTRQFNVKDEVEVKDDLDKKPDLSAKDLDGVIETYFNDLSEFLENLRKLHSIEKFDASFETFKTKHISYHPCPETGFRKAADVNSHIDRWLEPAIIEANFAADNATWLAGCLPSDGLSDRKNAQTSGLSLSYDKTELGYELSIYLNSADRSGNLHGGLTRAFESFEIARDDSASERLAVLYKHTKLSTSNNQVFIVTRLPRAGLDALLAKDAK